MEYNNSHYQKGDLKMTTDIKTLLNEEIGSELNALGDLDVGTEEYKVTVDGVVKLIDKQIEMDKLERDSKAKEREYELDSKKFEADKADKAAGKKIEDAKLKILQEERKDHRFNKTMDIAKLTLPLLVTIWGTLVTFKYEETGTVTTSLGKGHLKNLMFRK